MKKFTTTFLTAILFLAPGLSVLAMEKGTSQPPSTPDLKPDQYIWNPEASPTGPVGIIVDLTNQTIYVYRGGKQIGRSTVSTGIKSHPTAPGSYTILTKNVEYHSEKYHEASMPFMERITCITKEGDTVLISDLKEAPGDTVDPGLVPQQVPALAPDSKSKVDAPRGGPAPTNVSPDATPIPVPAPAPNTSVDGSPTGGK